MRRHIIGIIGIVLVVVSLAGAVIAAVVLGRSPSGVYAPPSGMRGRRSPRSAAPSSGPYGGFATPGQRIFFAGVGSAGPIPRAGGFGMMASAGCANCHGPDGRGGRIGGMMGGGIEAPDIRYSTLTSRRSEEDTAEPAWTDAQIAVAVRDGKEPDGRSLSSYMPRWEMDDQDMSDLLAYLKELK